MDNAMSILEKLKSLAQSRRFWVLVAQAAVSLVVLAGLIMPVLGLDAPETPDVDAVTDRLATAGERIAAVLGAVITLLALGANTGQTITGYTHRPPGVADRTGTLNTTFTMEGAAVGGAMSGGVQAGGAVSAGGDVAGRDVRR